ncbi:MAG: hypothetical protein KME15_28180 [Drouetiella hepatica Uher 2000/2452]|jgi:hypothetical protein|uniref:Uncharacterized protein n=1 Tax=Drouetiella hepatica Uher 2000/2452 TaxID=904376 RepID=A0A951UQB8_9CYAN|nr:hypothetical protein [Drouetiella hepatica Uher 2000/2452]
MLPVVIHEALIQSFSFYGEGCIREGMSYGQQIYRLVQSYEIASRLHAYSLGCDLSHQGSRTVVTVCDRQYKVWVELRSQAEIRLPEDKGLIPSLS